MAIEIIKYESKYHQQVVDVWERAVLATHDFLKPTHFLEIKTNLIHFDLEKLQIFCLIENQKVLGFIDIQHRKVEMLFIDPCYRGRGLGKYLIYFAIQNFKINFVDVNAQNTQAVDFYKRLGFQTFEKTELDDFGFQYPLYRMKLK